MKIKSLTRRFVHLTLSVAIGLFLTFIADLFLHPHELEGLKDVQNRSIASVKAFTPWEFGSRFVEAMSPPPPHAMFKRIVLNEPGVKYWAAFAHGFAVIFKPPVALVDVLLNTFPSFLSLGFVLTVVELTIGGMLVSLYVMRRLPALGPFTLPVFALLTVAAGTVVAAIGWFAAQAGLIVFGGFLDLAQALSAWIALAGLGGFVGVKYAEAAAHAKAELLAKNALHLE